MTAPIAAAGAAASSSPAAADPGIRRIGALVLALITLGLIALVVAGGFGVRTLAQGEDRTELVQHTRDVEVAIARVGTQAERSEAARRAYLLQQDERFRTTWSETAAELTRTVTQLERLVDDNAAQLARARELRRLVVELQALESGSIAAAARGAVDEAQADFRADRSADLLREIRRRRQLMSVEEARLLEARNRDRAEALTNFYAILGLCSALVLAIIGACIFVIRRYTGELAISRDALQRLNADLEGAVRERTSELHRANEEIQRFAYIVSHDLRSPLVNVMGFTSELESARQPLAKLVASVEEKAPELVTREAKLAVDEDLPEAVRFIRTSTQKMDRLINAILKLSREGRRTLAPEQLPMTQLVQSMADALKHRTEEAGVEIIVEPLPDIASDRVAIEQIFSNLVENAVKYLKQDRPGRIRVSGRQEAAGRIVYEIEDNGRGIDPRDHQRIFDLFRRSGPQDQPGEGIGLAHVRSLVWRLGGTIEVDSSLDAGATFRLSLPIAITGEEDN
jgi:signal transduction histidine kinase